MGAGSESAAQDCMPEEAEFFIDGSPGRFDNENVLVITGAKCLVGSEETVAIDDADSVVALEVEGSHTELDIASSLDAFGI